MPEAVPDSEIFEFGEKLVPFPTVRGRLFCAIADPLVLARFEQAFQQVNLNIECHYVTDFDRVIATLDPTQFEYAVLDALIALDFLRLSRRQIPAIALVTDAEDPLIEHLTQAGIADYLDHENLNSYQLRRGLYHLHKVQKHNQQISETAQVKNLFLAIVSHELRTPMNAILGFSQVLLKQSNKSLGDRQRQILERIHNNGRSLMALINDILDCSQIKIDELQLLPGTFDLEGLVSNIVTELQSLAEEKQLSLEVFNNLRDPQITHDQKRIRQILVNLIVNALSFTKKGSVHIYLWEEQGQVCIQVKDTGVGIAPEHLDNIFNEFWQAQPNIHRAKSGTGLGLAIIYALLEKMQGAIAVESQLGQGSSFTVTIPRSFKGKR